MADQDFVDEVMECLADVEAAQLDQDAGRRRTTHRQWQEHVDTMQGYFDDVQGGELDLTDETLDELEDKLERALNSVKGTYLNADAADAAAPNDEFSEMESSGDLFGGQSERADACLLYTSDAADE